MTVDLSEVLNKIQGLNMSAKEIGNNSGGFSEEMISDYLDLFQNMIILAEVLVDMVITDIGTDMTDGSVPFSKDGFLAEDNNNFFWDDDNNRLGIGTNTPVTALDSPGSGLVGLIQAAKVGDYTTDTDDSMNPIPVNTSGGNVTIDLDATPDNGVEITVIHQTAGNTCIIDPNGNTLNGDAAAFNLNVAGEWLTMKYQLSQTNWVVL